MRKIIKNKNSDFSMYEIINEEEVDLRDILITVWRNKLIILITFILFALSSIAVALSMPNIYRAEATVAPTDETQGGGISAIASKFSGLASLAGVNLGGNNTVDRTQLALAVLKSRKFISQVIQSHDMLPDLMAISEWNGENNSISYDPEIYDSVSDTWVRKVNFPKEPKPSLQEAYQVFQKLLTVTDDRKNGLVFISIEHQSPFVAKQWVDWLIKDINSEMRRRDVAEANKNLEYLKTEIQKTNISDIRSVLFSLVEEQTKTIMFAKVRDEYIFKTIDPAITPEIKIKPKRTVIVVVSSIVGLLFGIVIVFLRLLFLNSFSRNKLDLAND